MPISNDSELVLAALQAGNLLQEIQDYAGNRTTDLARVRFPRGYMGTAASYRQKFPFVRDPNLIANISYTFMLMDAVSWPLNRTDIAATAKEMLIKIYIFLVGTLIESVTKDYLKDICGKGYKERTQYLVAAEILNADTKEELDWVWDMRNNMHLFLLSRKEFINSYNQNSYERCLSALNTMIEMLTKKGRLN